MSETNAAKDMRNYVPAAVAHELEFLRASVKELFCQSSVIPSPRHWEEWVAEWEEKHGQGG